MKLGPNMNRLILHKLAKDEVPRCGRFEDVIELLQRTGRLTQAVADATKWVCAAIAAVKAAPGNRWGDDDEAIAGEILRRLGKDAPA